MRSRIRTRLEKACGRIHSDYQQAGQMLHYIRRRVDRRIGAQPKLLLSPAMSPSGDGFVSLIYVNEEDDRRRQTYYSANYHMPNGFVRLFSFSWGARADRTDFAQWILQFNSKKKHVSAERPNDK